MQRKRDGQPADRPIERSPSHPLAGALLPLSGSNACKGWPSAHVADKRQSVASTRTGPAMFGGGSAPPRRDKPKRIPLQRLRLRRPTRGEQQRRCGSRCMRRQRQPLNYFGARPKTRGCGASCVFPSLSVNLSASPSEKAESPPLGTGNVARYAMYEAQPVFRVSIAIAKAACRSNKSRVGVARIHTHNPDDNGAYALQPAVVTWAPSQCTYWSLKFRGDHRSADA